METRNWSAIAPDQHHRRCVIQPSVGRRGRATLGDDSKMKTTSVVAAWRRIGCNPATSGLMKLLGTVSQCRRVGPILVATASNDFMDSSTPMNDNGDVPAWRAGSRICFRRKVYDQST